MKHQFTVYCLLCFLLSLSTLLPLKAQVLDPTFQPTTLQVPYSGALQSGVQRILVQPDGKILVAGGFDFVNGTLASKIQRLHADGTRDAGFNPGGLGANGFIGAMALQADGKILIGGGFSAYNNTPALALARLNADGTLDTSFTSLVPAALCQITSLAVQADGKILVGNTPLTGGRSDLLLRLQADGTPDPTFSSTASGYFNYPPNGGSRVTHLLVQADGKILVCGKFLGQPNELVRVNPDGTLDTTFAMGTSATGTVYNMAQQPDGKLLVVGFFSKLNGQPSPSIARLSLDGTLDPTFTPGTGATTTTGATSTITSVQVLPSGKLAIGGYFTQYNGVSRGRVARLNADGTLDTGFAAGVGATVGVIDLAALAGEQLLVAGALTQYDALPVTGLVRITAAGTADPAFQATFQARGTISAASPLTNGQLLISGTFSDFNGVSTIRRLQPDGSLDLSYTTSAQGLLYGARADGSFYTLSSANGAYLLQRILPSGALDHTFTAVPFGSTTQAGATFTLRGITRQPDGRLLVFGYFTTYGGAARNSLARLNADGTLDPSFTPPSLPANAILPDVVTAVVVQPSGKLVIAYGRTLSGVSGTVPISLARLLADGTLDPTYTVGSGVGSTGYATLLGQPDGKVLVNGNFTSFNGQAVPYGLLRLDVEGAIDTSFKGVTSPAAVYSVLSDGRILALSGQYGSSTLVRLRADGSRDTDFTPVAIPVSFVAGDDALNGVAVQPTDGKIVLFGSFRSVAGQLRVSLARLQQMTVTASHAAAAIHRLTLYPNPAAQHLTVQLPAASASPLQVLLLDLTGHTLHRWDVPAQQAEVMVDLGSVPAGMYIVSLTTAGVSYQQKVVVTR